MTVRRSIRRRSGLYEKRVYHQIDIWSMYYHNGEDGLVFEKRVEVTMVWVDSLKIIALACCWAFHRRAGGSVGVLCIGAHGWRIPLWLARDRRRPPRVPSMAPLPRAGLQDRGFLISQQFGWDCLVGLSFYWVLRPSPANCFEAANVEKTSVAGDYFSTLLRTLSTPHTIFSLRPFSA